MSAEDPAGTASTNDIDFASADPAAGVGLCLSGGGYRAMLFHAGSLARLNEAGWLPKLTRVTSVSALPIVHANPALVVANAVKPSCCNARALPASHGFGITKHPDSWSRWNSAIRSSRVVMGST